MLSTGAEALPTYIKISGGFYGENAAEVGDTGRRSEGISNPSLRPLGDLPKFLSSLISYMPCMDL